MSAVAEPAALGRLAEHLQRLYLMSIFAAAHPLLAEALAERGYTAMTEVQSAVLSDSCQEQDLLVSARTGSGKTVAFGLSIAVQLRA